MGEYALDPIEGSLCVFFFARNVLSVFMIGYLVVKTPTIPHLGE